MAANWAASKAGTLVARMACLLAEKWAGQRAVYLAAKWVCCLVAPWAVLRAGMSAVWKDGDSVDRLAVCWAGNSVVSRVDW